MLLHQESEPCSGTSLLNLSGARSGTCCGTAAELCSGTAPCSGTAVELCFGTAPDRSRTAPDIASEPHRNLAPQPPRKPLRNLALEPALEPPPEPLRNSLPESCSGTCSGTCSRAAPIRSEAYMGRRPKSKAKAVGEFYTRHCVTLYLRRTMVHQVRQRGPAVHSTRSSGLEGHLYSVPGQTVRELRRHTRVVNLKQPFQHGSQDAGIRTTGRDSHHDNSSCVPFYAYIHAHRGRCVCVCGCVCTYIHDSTLQGQWTHV